MRNKRLLVNLILYRNASKFAMFMEKKTYVVLFVFHSSNFWSISLEDQVDHQKPLFSEERCIAYVKTGVCNCMEIGIGSRTTDIFLKFLLLLTLTKCIHFEKKKKNLLLNIILYCIQLCSNNILLRCNGTSHTTYLSSLTTRAHVIAF